jgi:hypothetical protein
MRSSLLTLLPDVEKELQIPPLAQIVRIHIHHSVFLCFFGEILVVMRFNGRFASRNEMKMPEQQYWYCNAYDRAAQIVINYD